MPGSFRSRLLIAFLGVVLVSLAVFLGLVWEQVRNYSRESRLEELRLRLDQLSQWVDPMSPEAKDAIHATSTEMRAALWLAYGDGRPNLYVSDGYAIPESDMPRVSAILEREALQPRAATLERGGLYFIFQPVAAAGHTALLAAIIPSANLEGGWQHLLGATRVALAVGLAISLVLALLVAASLARPVTRLTNAARRMADGFYEDPPLPAGKDEIGRLTRAFDAMRTQVRSARQRERDFLSGVSHDLKTPLAVIQGYASAIADGAAADEASRQRALGGIQREAERMNRLIAALLELARLQSGLVPFHAAPVDLTALLRNMLTQLSAHAQEKGVGLADKLPAALPLIRADAAQIERVFQNLLDNAIRFTPPGGAVTVGGDNGDDGRITLWVQDTGPGIPSDALTRIFDRFYQVDAARSAGQRGSGLGLAIAREIVARHGGKIRAESQIGQGARFVVTLPVSDKR